MSADNGNSNGPNATRRQFLTTTAITAGAALAAGAAAGPKALGVQAKASQEKPARGLARLSFAPRATRRTPQGDQIADRRPDSRQCR